MYPVLGPWYAANTRAGYTDDANSDLQSLNGNIEIFRVLMSRDLSSQTVDQIKDMFLFAAWNTANTHAGPGTILMLLMIKGGWMSYSLI